MHIRILDKYIFKEILLTFLFSICAFTAVQSVPYSWDPGRCSA